MIASAFPPAMLRLLDRQPIVWDHPINRGLSARYKVVHGVHGGKRLWDLTARRHGTLQSTAAWSGPGSLAGSQGALSLNGTSGYVSLGQYRINGECTILATIRPTTVAAGTREVYCAEGTLGPTDIAADINRTAAKLSIHWGSSVILTGSGSLVANTAYQIGYVRRGSTGSWTAETYINGGLDASTATATNPNSTSPTVNVAIGRLGTTALFYFPGLMDDIWVYNGRALSATEIANATREIRRGSPETLRWLSTRYVSVPAMGIPGDDDGLWYAARWGESYAA